MFLCYLLCFMEYYFQFYFFRNFYHLWSDLYGVYFSEVYLEFYFATKYYRYFSIEIFLVFAHYIEILSLNESIVFLLEEGFSNLITHEHICKLKYHADTFLLQKHHIFSSYNICRPRVSFLTFYEQSCISHLFSIYLLNNFGKTLF